MGANISGEGTNVIEINGVKELKSVKYRVMPDRIEAEPFMCRCNNKGKSKDFKCYTRADCSNNIKIRGSWL